MQIVTMTLISKLYSSYLCECPRSNIIIFPRYWYRHILAGEVSMQAPVGWSPLSFACGLSPSSQMLKCPMFHLAKTVICGYSVAFQSVWDDRTSRIRIFFITTSYRILYVHRIIDISWSKWRRLKLVRVLIPATIEPKILKNACVFGTWFVMSLYLITWYIFCVVQIFIRGNGRL